MHVFKELLYITNGEFNELYSSPTIVRVIKSRRDGGACSTYGGRCVYRIVLGKPEGKRPLGRPRRRWEDYVKIDLQGVGCGGMD